MSTVIGGITLGNFINDIVVSGFSVTPGYPVVSATLKAHPSNSGVLYVRQRASTVIGYPLNPGETVTLTGVDLYQYTASGVTGQRLEYIVNT